MVTAEAFNRTRVQITMHKTKDLRLFLYFNIVPLHLRFSRMFADDGFLFFVLPCVCVFHYIFVLDQ